MNAWCSTMSDFATTEAEAAGPHSSPGNEAEAEVGPVILRFEKVSKAFRRFEHQPFLARNLFLHLAGRANRPKELWPLRDVSFEIFQGETVGLIGQNGAGKSTLLRIVAGASFPTEGRVSVRGRIAPLLALGAGFQPDMTGRECVEINATALGLSKQEIDDRMDAITAFAELDDFLDTPTRYYSSGMVARLGFAVAIHTTPDLLIVDEALSVGDHNFQKKCSAKIAELRRDGTTILLVSHATGVVQELCNRVLWLRDGRLVADGAPGPILEEYLRG
jgi:ABC-type polysaccharide/polyol phosphate transport system ATPase subunit